MVVLLVKKKPSELTPIVEPIKDSLYFELKRLIGESGFMEPVLITGKGLIVDGCRRHAIAMENGAEYIDCVVLEGEHDREDLLRLRGMLHCSRRPLCLNEIQALFVERDEIPCGGPEKPRSRKVEQIIEDMLCARGLGPRIMLEIVRHSPIVMITKGAEEEEIEQEDLEKYLEDFEWLKE